MRKNPVSFVNIFRGKTPALQNTNLVYIKYFTDVIFMHCFTFYRIFGRDGTWETHWTYMASSIASLAAALSSWTLAVAWFIRLARWTPLRMRAFYIVWLKRAKEHWNWLTLLTICLVWNTRKAFPIGSYQTKNVTNFTKLPIKYQQNTKTSYARKCSRHQRQMLRSSRWINAYEFYRISKILADSLLPRWQRNDHYHGNARSTQW